MTKNYIPFAIVASILFSCNSKPEEEKVVDSIVDLEFISLFKSEDPDIISCYRIPAIVTAPNGDLVVAIDERVPSCGDLKWSDNINIVARRSSDGGSSWTEIERVVDFPFGQSASDPSMIVDSETEEIFMFYNFMDLEKEKDVYYLHYVKSKDNGASWSDPVDITSQIAKPEWHGDFKFITSGRGIQTSTGTLVHCMVNLDHGMHLFGSDDHGESWYLIDTPIIPANESKIIELADGRWMINSRVNGQKLRYVHISNDLGKSWESYPDSTLTDPNCNASIIRYSSKNAGEENLMLFSNANMDSSRTNMTIKYSTDEGSTWSEGRTVYAEGSAYSTMTVLQDGSVGLVFEKDGYADNVFVKLSLDWIKGN